MRKSRERVGWKERLVASGAGVEVGQAELHQGAHGVLEPRLARGGERLLVALPDLLGGDPLLEPVVAGHEEVLNPLADVLGQPSGTLDGDMLQALAVWSVLVAFALIGLILMHSGRDTGFGGMGFTPASQGGTHIVERNLTRLTVVVAVIFFLDAVGLFQLLK